MLLTGYLENLVPLPDPSILSSYTVSLNLKKKKKIYNTGSSWGQNITLYHTFLQILFYLILIPLSFPLPPTRSQLMVLMTWIYDSLTLLLH